MDPKRKSVSENPPPASSSDSESSEELTDTEQQNLPQKPNPADSSDTDEKESSDEEDEKKREENEKPLNDKTAKPNSKSDSDSEETGSDTESSESAPSPTASAFKIQKNYDAAITQKPAQSANASASKLAAKKAVSDAKSNANESQNKVKPENGCGKEKKLSFARLWGDDDELALLQGMEEFRSKLGHDPYADRDIFLEFIKKSLKFEVTKSQLMEKIRRLKMKYDNYAKKGGAPVISKPHELKLFELSKKVWGEAGVESSAKVEKRKAVKTEGVQDLVSNGEKSNKKAKGNVEVNKSLNCMKENGIKKGLDLCDSLKSDQEGFWDVYPFFKEALEIENSGYFSKGGMRSIMVELTKFGAAKVKEMEDKWRGIYAKEMELKLLRSELVKEQTKLVLDAVKTLKL